MYSQLQVTLTKLPQISPLPVIVCVLVGMVGDAQMSRHTLVCLFYTCVTMKKAK